MKSPKQAALDLAARVKTLRLERRWTQEELASRAGMTLATYRRFERTGLISLNRLLWIAAVFGSLDQFDQLFQQQPTTLDEIEKREARNRAQRGRRRDAKARGPVQRGQD
ncbi:MAG: helix-turn-helix transcriptional regulator [Trueperaceae bacterium]|nr:helix-turn-helix transcriptional regulator [Trueperaceae bacterium]